MKMCQAYVYILASKRNGTIYIGVTSNLVKRVYEHRTQCVDGFSTKYHTHKLVYFEVCQGMSTAITREKQLKKWNRLWEMRLIEQFNPEWTDLYSALI